MYSNNGRGRMSRRAKLLASAGGAVLATINPGLASALPIEGATVTIDQFGVGSATASLPLQNTSENTGEVRASVVDTVGSATQNGNQVASSTKVTDNEIKAAAGGNEIVHKVDLGDPQAEQGGAVASLSQSTNTGLVRSAVTSNELIADLYNASYSAVSNDGNSIGASTAVNAASTKIITIAPAGGMESIGSGTISISSTDFTSQIMDDRLDARGSLVSVVSQDNLTEQYSQQYSPDLDFESGNSALTAGNDIWLDVHFGGEGNGVASMSVKDNDVSADYVGNDATNKVTAAEGGAPTLSQSVVVGTVQTTDGGLFGGEGGTGAYNVENYIGGWADTGFVEDDTTSNMYSVFSGDLDVSGNALTASATANNAAAADGSAGNSIHIDGLSVEGYEYAYAGAGADLFGAEGGVSGANADLAVANRQENRDSSLQAGVSWGVIEGYADDLVGGSVTVNENAMESKALGNNAGNAIVVDGGAATFAATAAISNLQNNLDTSIEARTEYSAVYAQAGDEGGEVEASTISANENSQRALAYGNSVNQSIAIEAANIPLGMPVWTQGGDGDSSVMAMGSLVVTNLQDNYETRVSAQVDPAIIAAEGDDTSVYGSRVEADGNLQEAVAVGSTATNGIALNGVNVGQGAGIANIQTSRDTWVSADVYAATEVGANSAVDSTLALTDNTQRAVAYANSASNTLSVEGTTFGQQMYFGLPVEGYAYEVFSDQAQYGHVEADVDADEDTAFQAYADGELLGSTMVNQGNAVFSVAAGNQASNGLSLNFTTIDNTGSFQSPMAHLDNEQEMDGTVSAEIRGRETIEADVDGDVVGSQVAVKDNRLEAFAYGNTATANVLAVKAVELATGGAMFDRDSGPAFELDNYQTMYGTVYASQVGDDEDATSIEAELDGDVIGSTVAVTGNRALTQASGNLAGNRLSVDANLAATSGTLDSYQSVYGDVSARAGFAGEDATPATEGESFTVDVFGGNIGGAANGQLVTLNQGVLYIDYDSVTDEQREYLLNNGWSMGEAALEANSSLLGTISWQDYTTLLQDGSIPLDQLIPGLPGFEGRFNQGGVEVELDNDVLGSTVRVADNESAVKAIANSTGNVFEVKANLLEAEDQYYNHYYGSNGPSFDIELDQHANESSVEAQIFGSFGVSVEEDFQGEDSTIAVEGNQQSATAVANAASNVLTVTANNIGGSEKGYGATTEIEADQDGAVQVKAASDLDLYAPANGSGNAVSISGNRNSAYAGVNDVSNTLAVSANNVSSGYDSDNVADEEGGDADHLIDNDQDAEGNIESSARTMIVNTEANALIANGPTVDVTLNSGAMTINGNVTVAEANANRASNAVTVTGAASQSASTALVNRQDSEADVKAEAQTIAVVALNAGSTLNSAALVDGAVALNGNSTTAYARGNSATNSMTASTSFAGFGDTVIDNDDWASAEAPAAMLNQQENSGSVSASATAAYGIALNGPSGAPTAVGSSVGVSGNAVAAMAVGNSATNLMVLNATPGGSAGGAVANHQVNSGAITATATSVTFGVGIPASGMLSAQAAVSGNQISASAVGNSATTSVSTGN